MSSDSATLWREAFSTFERLLELDAPTRELELGKLAQSHPELHSEVVRLISTDQQMASSDFLSGNALESVASDLPGANSGSAVGPYVLLRELGSGGMGQVWLARRADGLFEMPVALKLLHPHLALSAVRSRFVREGRILGQLTHPNVARLLDAGVADSGQLYLAIEYVEGNRLDDCCDQQKLGVEARLQLFLQICEAVSHAHAHLVVHRDLKPSNVLVTLDGNVKLLDFGIAKLVDAGESSVAQTELTQVGGRVLTPQYAAPEQVSGLVVTVATDVYSLGVLLYLLLSGRRPYGKPGDALSQIEHDVLTTEPAPPSRTRFSDSDSVQLAALRGSTPQKLRATLAGDLDTIVLKALKKAPRDRYPSVAAMAEDVRRYLDHLPVLAQPDSFAYRARKYLRRNRVAVSASAAVALALIAGVAGTLWQAQQTRLEARRAERVKDFLVSVFQQADPEHTQGEKITARQWLEQGVLQVNTQLSGEPAVQADLWEVLAQIDLSLGLYARAALHAQSSAELRRGLYGDNDVRVAAALLLQGGALIETREAPDRALTVLSEAERIYRAAGDELQRARVQGELSVVLGVLGQGDESIAVQQQAIATLARLLGPRHSETGMALHALGERQEEDGRYPEAERAYMGALAVLSESPGAKRSSVADVHRDYAAFLDRMGRSDEADPHFVQAIAIQREVYGNDSPKLADTLFSRAVLLISTRRLKQADEALLETLRIYPPGGYRAAQSQRYLGVSLIQQQRYAEAAVRLQAAMEDYRRIDGPDAEVQQFRTLSDLATARLREGGVEQALPMLRESVAKLESLVGGEGYDVRTPLKRLGEALIAARQYQEAIATLRRVRDLEIKLFNSEDHRDLASTQHLLGEALLDGGGLAAQAEARVAVDRAVALQRAHFSGDTLARSTLLSARVAMAQGDPARARREVAEALPQLTNEDDRQRARSLLKSAAE